MPVHTIHRSFTEIEHQLTQIDENRKLASEILKRVDHLIKAKDLQKALLETNNAIKIDPQNAYALALEERIQDLFAEQSKIQPQKEEMKSQPEFATEAPKEAPKKHYRNYHRLCPRISIILLLQLRVQLLVYSKALFS